MTRILSVLMFVATVSGCNLDCVVGFESGQACGEKKKGDLRLFNKNSWKLVNHVGIEWQLSEYGDLSIVTIGPGQSAEFYDTVIPPDGTLRFTATYQPPAGLDTPNMDVNYTIPMVENADTKVDLNGQKLYGDWLTPSSGDITVTHPTPPTTSSGGGGTSGGGDSCAGASSGPCKGYADQCDRCKVLACQAVCYCAAACVCHYCGDTSCEQSNRKPASDLGTTCSY